MKPLYYILILASLSLPFQSFGQMQDFVWFIGGAWHTGNQEEYQDGVVWLDFSKDGYTVDTNRLHFPQQVRSGSGRSVMADEEGNLLFYYDGFDVYNRRHSVMKNGNKVFDMADLIGDHYNAPGAVNIPNWTLTLPVPGHTDRYKVIYVNITRNLDEDFYVSNGLLYSTVNMSGDGGWGEVEEKNQKLYDGQLMTGNLIPIRHANGRDWWIIAKAWGEAKWNLFMLDPDGLRLSHSMRVEDYPDFHGQIAFYDYSSDQYVVMSGEHFVPWQVYEDEPYDHTFHIFDFDRCSGTFNFDRNFEIYTWNNRYATDHLTFCPRGRFLYGSLGGHFFIQYDTWAEDVDATADTLLSRFEDYPLRSFYSPAITPRGEMLLGQWIGDNSIIKILNPELPAEEVNISEELIKTPKIYTGAFPNNANYRIGPIDGSPCDTLGINNEPVAWYRYNGMNLEHLERRFTDISYFRPEQWHWDFDDGTTYDGQHPGVHEFPGPGEYYVCLTVSNEFAEDTYCKWVVIDSLVSTTELIVGETDFRLYPNPGTGDFTLELSDPLTSPATLTVVDMLGREVHRETTSAGSVDILLSLSRDLPPGRYAITLQNEDGVLRGDLVLVR